jgi:hypothetical protein
LCCRLASLCQELCGPAAIPCHRLRIFDGVHLQRSKCRGPSQRKGLGIAAIAAI